MNVMFCDIRSYSLLAEAMTPEENFNFINAYLRRVGPIIRAHGGFINHYFGDGFIALFKDSSRDAVQAGLDIFSSIEEYNIHRQKTNRKPIQIGIGLHTGEVMMGIIGDIERNDANVISDSVNTASRLEGLTKYYSSNFIISEATCENIKRDGNFSTRFLGRVKVKGKEDILPIYEVIDADTSELRAKKQTALTDYHRGIEHYFNREFDKAIAAFTSVINQVPEDFAAMLFVRRCREYIDKRLPDNWNGVEEMTEK